MMSNIKDRTEEAIRHWVCWAFSDESLKAGTCRSIEKFYSFDKSRYGWPCDVPKNPYGKFKPCYRTAEKVENIICEKFISMEKICFLARRFYGVGHTSKEIAKELDIPIDSFHMYYDRALIKIGRAL